MGSRKACARIWSSKVRQRVGSAATDRGQVPRVFRRIRFSPGTWNADIGGGASEAATKWLMGKGVQNVVFDPFNRSAAHNRDAAALVCGGKAATATVANVLNVIREPAARRRVIEQAADAVGRCGVAFFSVHHDAGAKPGPTPSGWQEQRPLASYEKEIARVFARVRRRGDLIWARQSSAEACRRKK